MPSRGWCDGDTVYFSSEQHDKLNLTLDLTVGSAHFAFQILEKFLWELEMPEVTCKSGQIVKVVQIS